jgi:ketosteroid isomerase-like protein
MTSLEQDLIALSQQKWDWMSAQDVTRLAALFHDDAVFVHMGATFTKPEELNVIDTGYIHYRDIDISDVSVRIIDTTAIVLTPMQLGSVVDGREVSNPFVVTEVYVQQGDTWTLGSMSFTRLITH